MVKKKVKRKLKCSSSAHVVEDDIRDLINWVTILSQEEVTDVTTRIEPKAAKVLVNRLSKLARKAGDACTCCK